MIAVPKISPTIAPMILVSLKIVRIFSFSSPLRAKKVFTALGFALELIILVVTFADLFFFTLFLNFLRFLN